MGLASFASSAGHVPIFRILKQGSFFICGICRHQYGRHELAQGCFSKCAHQQLAKPAVVSIRVRNVDFFRCNYCNRDYRKVDDAKECASECKGKIKAKIAESGLMETSNHSEPQTATQASPAITRTATTTAPAVADVKPPLPSSEPAVETSEVASEAIVVEGDDNGGDNAKKPKKKRDPTKKFHRDGARYVCQDCGEKYFTKAEVEACFDKHD